MLEVQYRPMVDTSWFRPASKRKASQFSAPWGNTLEMLEREVTAIKGTDLTIELEVLPAQIRADGSGLKAHQQPVSPAVVVSMESPKGALSFKADALTRNYGHVKDWQHNVRAVVVTLEALRGIDRWGASRGEQYTGYAALPPGATAIGPSISVDQAIDRLVFAAGAARVDADQDLATVARSARAATHPDRTGLREPYDKVDEAVQRLVAAGRLPA